MPVGDRARATGAVLRRWTVPQWRMLADDVERNALRLRHGTYEGASSSSSGYWV